MFNASVFTTFASGTGEIEWKSVIYFGGKHIYHWLMPNYVNQMEHFLDEGATLSESLCPFGEADGYDL